MSIRDLSLGVLLPLVVACSSSPSDAVGGSASPSAKAAGTAAGGKTLCDKAQALKDRIATIDAKAVRIATQVTLPTGSDGVLPPVDASILEIGDKQITLNGKPVKDPSDIAAQAGNRPSHAMIIAADAHASMKALPSLFEGLSGFQIYVVASPKDSKREPAPAAIAKAVESPEPSQRAQAMAEALKKSISGCPAAGKVFQTLSAVEHEAQVKKLQNDLPIAVDSCGCKVDDDLVGTIAYLLAGDTPIVGKRLDISKEGNAKKLSFADLDGQKLYDALSAGGH